jgi:hypothetical protein
MARMKKSSANPKTEVASEAPFRKLDCFGLPPDNLGHRMSAPETRGSSKIPTSGIRA